MKDMSRSTLLKLLGLMAVGTIVISAIMVPIDWLGMDGSLEKGQIATMFSVTIVLSALVFSVVMVMMGYAIWKYRAKPGDESDGEPIHGNTRLEIIWTAIPTVMVIALAVYSTIVLDDIEKVQADAPQMEVQASAQQFAWRFDYPEQDISSTELHVPSGTQLQLELNALDVLHSFWVPEWGIKRDLVPGLGPARRGRHRQHRQRHPRRAGHLHGRLHGALRVGARDDERGRRGPRVAGGLRRVGGRADGARRGQR